ncbi:MAG: hypothetical protein DRI44_07595 [Chlamydiae bacterium]|nr:MAG: hypothetical protein DRI44_07595 [Chlamydiota bacterium]
MFKTERMKLIQIIALDEDVIPICDYLIKKKIVHLIDHTFISTALREGTPAELSNTLSEIELIEQKLKKLSSWIADNNIEINLYVPESKIIIDPIKICNETKQAVEENVQTLAASIDEIHNYKVRIDRLNRISDALQSFETAGVSYEEVSKFNFFDAITGTMPRRFIPQLRRSMQQVPHHFELRNLSEDEVSLIVICTKEAKKNVIDTLKNHYFSEIKIPDEYSGNPHDALDSIEFNLWSLREEAAATKHNILSLCSSLAPKVGIWQKVVKANASVLNAMRLFGKTARTTCISGWIPGKSAGKIENEIKSLTPRPIKIELSSPDESSGLASSLKKEGNTKVPSKFRHPAFLKPFQMLITTYGYPAYDGIDPTFFVALTFTLMFGMMFGDIGHGAVLTAIGFFIAKSKTFKSIRGAGWLMVTVGCSAIFFGLMFGSIFGIEFHSLSLWLMPLEDTKQLLGTAVLLGILIITVGIILNLIQSVKRKNYKEFLFGQWGLLSGCFYWMALGVFFLALIKDKNVPVGLTVAVLLIPIVLIVLGDVFYAKLFEKNETHSVDEDEHSAAETIFKPIEITLGFVTQTVSFVRVGAFALNHAALMMVVYQLARMGGGMTGPEANIGSQLSYIIAAVTGNIFVMLLEGLVVFIQCLRLEYYEFFSKFFEGDGIKFKPLKIEDN